MSAALQDPRTDCAPLYTLRCLAWRRRQGSPFAPVMGRASFLIVEMGIVLHGCAVSRLAKGRTVIEFAERPGGDGHFRPCADFLTPEARGTFTTLAWRALIDAFPYAHTAPIGVTVKPTISGDATHE